VTPEQLSQLAASGISLDEDPILAGLVESNRIHPPAPRPSPLVFDLSDLGQAVAEELDALARCLSGREREGLADWFAGCPGDAITPISWHLARVEKEGGVSRAYESGFNHWSRRIMAGPPPGYVAPEQTSQGPGDQSAP
jgi:hypothetical protein